METKKAAARMTIGKVAKASGVGIETIRFYEKDGLLDKPARRVSGYREYDDAVVSRLLFIRQAKDLGFALLEIKELLTLRLKREVKMRFLGRIKRALVKLTDACDERAPTSECPILAALDRNNRR